MTTSHAGRVARYAALGLAAVATLAACTTSGHAEAGPSTTLRPTPIESPPPSSIAPTPTPTPETSIPASPTESATTSAAATTTAATSSPPPPPQTTCTSVDVRVIRGSPGLGQEIAALDFVNSGTTRCVLAGYPTAQLLLHGKPIGQPSQPSSTASSVRTLEPGDVAESLLHDYTNCQAPLSDSVRVTIPGTTMEVVRPAQLRACVVRVDRLRPPD